MKSKSYIICTFIFLMISTIGYCQAPLNKVATVDEISDTTFVNLKDYSSDFIYDMRYATDNNFLKAQVYDCAECLIRYKTVKALIKVNNAFMRKGFQIKLYDCYRPLDIQKRMWTIVPNPKYVADPSKGSIHNRGGAVDITLVNLDGEAVPMGTDFDFFGIEASHKYINLPTDVISNRKFLKKIMAASGFQSFDSEWWHYNLKSALKDPVSNAKWDCN